MGGTTVKFTRSPHLIVPAWDSVLPRGHGNHALRPGRELPRVGSAQAGGSFVIPHRIRRRETYPGWFPGRGRDVPPYHHPGDRRTVALTFSISTGQIGSQEPMPEACRWVDV